MLMLIALQPNQVILTLTNPTDVLTHVTLLPCDPDADNWSTAKVCFTHKIAPSKHCIFK